MVKKLQKHGNSQALVIEKPLMEALGIDAETPLQVTVSGHSLIVTPVHVGIGRREVEEALERLRPRYVETLPPPDALEAMTMRVAASDCDKEELTQWLREQVPTNP